MLLFVHFLFKYTSLLLGFRTPQKRSEFVSAPPYVLTFVINFACCSFIEMRSIWFVYFVFVFGIVHVPLGYIFPFKVLAHHLISSFTANYINRILLSLLSSSLHSTFVIVLYICSNIASKKIVF